MNKSESITHLAAALAKAQAEMPVAVLDATNPFLKNKYASLGSVITASRPVLAKHKLSLVQFPVSEIRDVTRPSDSRAPACSVLDGPSPSANSFRSFPNSSSPPGAEREKAAQQHRPTTEFIGVESILTHESGEFIAERILIALTDEKGKSRVQAAGSVLTYLRRYSWAAILGMYADEDADGSSPAQAFEQKPAPTPAPPSVPPVPTRKAVSRN
jgi:hypothetical protein